MQRNTMVYIFGMSIHLTDSGLEKVGSPLFDISCGKMWLAPYKIFFFKKKFLMQVSVDCLSLTLLGGLLKKMLNDFF